MRTRSIFATALLSLAALAATARAADIDVLKQRLVEHYRSTISTSSAASYLSSQRADGGWDGIDYADTSRTGWVPVQHLSRLKAMAVAWAKPGDALNNSAAVVAAVRKGLDFWYATAPTSTNWWYNDIGKQLELEPIALVFESQLTAAEKASIIGDFATAPSMTGENRVWISGGVVHRGLLEASADRVSAGLAGVQETIVVTTAEGVQHDWSFHQHGPQLYNGGYGMGFVSDSSFWAHITRATSFAFTSAQLDVLTGLMLDGNRWMVRGTFFDESADGREISRKDQTAKGLSAPCTFLAEVNPGRAAELDAFRAHIAGTAGPPVSGNRHFWRSDFMTHQRPSFYASLKMVSSRTTGTESINSENLLGYWLPYGLTFLVQRGDEYQNIYPIWDWKHLPGVTAPEIDGAPDGKHTSTFVGGTSTGTHGAAAMDLDKALTTGKRAWFFFDGAVVAVGAAIASTNTAHVATTLNQAFLKGTVSIDGQPLAGTSVTTSAAKWVLHDGIGYALLQPGALTVKAGPRTGHWGLINSTGSTTAITQDVFAAWIDHGAAPASASYEYAVVPGVDAAAMAAWAAAPPVRVLANTADLQAVRDDPRGVTGLVFRKPGAVTLHSGVDLAVDQPCIAVVEEGAGETRITLANPLNQPLTVDVTLTRSGRTTALAFTLPDVPWAGQSVTKALLDDGTIAEPSDGAIEATREDAGADAPSDARHETSSGGCGCQTSPPAPSALLLVAMAAALLLARRRAPALIAGRGGAEGSTRDPRPRR